MLRLNVKEDILVFGDADYLARAFQNLLRNAISYSDKNSIIHIGAFLQGDNTISENRKTTFSISLPAVVAKKKEDYL